MPFDDVLELLRRGPVGIVGSGQPARPGAVQHHRSGAFRMRFTEQEAQRAALRDAEDRRSDGSGRVHDRPDVLHSLVDRRRVRDGIGHARPPLVEHDQTRE